MQQLNQNAKKEKRDASRKSLPWLKPNLSQRLIAILEMKDAL
jgi:hypothetical protein